MKKRLTTLCLLFCVLALQACDNENRKEADTTPPKPAIPSNYRIGIELSSQINMHPAGIKALQSIGINYINYYINTFPDRSDLPAKEVNGFMMGIADKLDVEFSISSSVYDVPSSAVHDALLRYEEKGRFRGILIDEFDHARFIYPTSYGMERSLIDRYAIKTIEEAHDAALKAYADHIEMMKQWGVQEVVSTNVWPVLNDFAARCGYVVCPKICKELYSSVSMAIGLGAAKQYHTPFWNDIDLWWWDQIPGHPAEEVKCNLLFSYWMGADLTYLEGCGYNLYPAGKQGSSFSLFKITDSKNYQLTPIGETLKWFIHDYLPKHPRKWSARDVKPSIAIIRYEDSWFGQAQTPFGCPNVRIDSDMSAWISIFNMLTFGATGDRCLTHPTPTESHSFFHPMNGTVVYNEVVDYSLLKEIPLLFITGKHISSTTMEAVKQCVTEGAVCVFWGNLAKVNGFGDWQAGVRVLPYGKGKFIITDDFKNETVREIIAPFIGKQDEIKYKFGPDEVIFKRVDDNAIDVIINGEVQKWESFKN